MQCCFSSKCIEFEGGLDILTRKLDKNTIFFALYKVLYRKCLIAIRKHDKR